MKNCIKNNRVVKEMCSNRALQFIKQQKLKASTLIESLVASVLVIVIFTIASLTLNNIFKATMNSNTDRVQNRMHTLEYLVINTKIAYPYQENFEDWEIRLIKNQERTSVSFVLEANKKTNSGSKKKISRKLRYAISQ